MKSKEIDKRTFKICESVALGLTYYYMGPKDKIRISENDEAMARKVIPTLPEGWMQKRHSWAVCR